MMVQRSDRCDTSRLDLLMRDRLAAEGQRELEKHLLACSACRSKLDQLAGGAPWWTEVRQYLGGNGPESPATMDQLEPRSLAELDLGFLQPSDNPVALGRLGKYEVLEVIGRGGMGLVLKGFDPGLHRPVAIKVLAAELAANGAARKRFAREAQAAAAVVHDHVVPVHEVDAQASPPYLVMAFLPGQSLQQRLDQSGPLELKEILRIGMQTAAGLAAAHAQGLVHRDIKPANIMLENGIERVRITDFGLARAVDDASVTQHGAVAGTPQYMAPEQARGEVVDQRADLFSLGSTLYAMCTGHAPFRGDSLAAIRQVCDTEPAPIRSINPDIPAWLEGIICKLHAKQPERRFQQASEVAELLERCLAHVQQPDRKLLPAVAEQLGWSVRSRAPARKNRQRSVLALAAVVAATAAFLFVPRPSAKQEAAGGEEALPESANPVEDFFGETHRLRSGLDTLGQSFASTAPTAAGTEAEFASAHQRADALVRGLGNDADPASDPVAEELTHIRQRLELLKEVINRRP
jgi:serine/threonine-protein kinase